MSKVDYNTSEYIIVYVYSLPDVTTHVGHVKVGKASIKLSDYALSSDKEKAIESAVRARIKEQVGTVELNYILEDYTLAIKKTGESFMDYDVHNVLKRSGISNIVHTEDKKFGEWFAASPETVSLAVEAVKSGRSALGASDIVNDAPMIFRKGSQIDAIEKTVKAIHKGKKHFLWDAKMRFGKTLTSLEVARRMNYGKVLIITHRPEVSDDWFKDFNKLFAGTDYKFGSRDKGENIARLQSGYLKGANGEQANPFVYFASVQYLRHEVKSAEKQAILAENWDMLIIDEADEGIKTALADETISPIPRDFTLMLSGTPFNLLEDYKEDEIYSWDYTKEQELKARWEELYPDEPNPYYKLPKLSIFVYDLNKYIPDAQYKDLTDKAFNFKEFFRVDASGEFIHEKDVLRFLNLITTEGDNNFPFSTKEYRQNLRHTLWMVPGVKEARALEKMLHDHPVFMHFNIANVAGDGNEEVAERKSRNLVKKAITNDPLSAYSITISCGKMTRGVSVPEWSAVFMLSNTTSASTYLQTIFRGQTPWEHQGILKTECFVFDFAPDRTLTIVAEVMNIKKKRPTTDEVKEATGKFLNYCSVISATHGEMKPFSVQKLLHAIKKVAIQKVTRNGFDDTRLYNIENLDRCSDDDLQDFATLNAIVGKSKGEKESKQIKMADNGFTEEEREKAKKAKEKKKLKQPLTPEEEELLRRKREIAEQRKTRMSILRGVSIRMPMLIFGCKIDKNGNEIKPDDEISLQQFIENVDDESWQEFMPDGVTKEMLSKKFAKYYDDEVFIGAGIDIRLRALAADLLSPSERVAEIAEIFKGFKNPDKETVLTPWRVVNMHLSSTLGGSNFNDIIEFDSEINQKGEKIGLPNWINQGKITDIWSDKNAKVLEINSKSGLYPLLCAYNFYDRALSEAIKDYHATEEDIFRKLWDEILKRNVYVLTKSPMAKTIAERTLAGYTGAKTNVVYISDLVAKLKQPDYDLLSELKRLFSLKGDEDMKFTAVVGNPPYDSGNGQQIYTDFYLAARKVGDNVSMIFPIGWQKPKTANNLGRLNSKEIKEDRQIVRINNIQNAFPGITGAEWTNIILWVKGTDNGLDGNQLVYTNGKDPEEIHLDYEKSSDNKPKEIVELANLVTSGSSFKSMSSLISSLKPYGLRTDFFNDTHKYGLPSVGEIQNDISDIKIYGLYNRKQTIRYIPKTYPLPKKTSAIYKHKVLVGKAWGNWSENYLGGAYSDIVIAQPGEIATENFLESGCFDSKDLAEKHAKYLMTRFLRALLFFNKHSQDNSKDKFSAVPQQDYSEPWWSEDIEQLETRLFDKYEVPQNIREFVLKNIQKKTEKNIVNYEK